MIVSWFISLLKSWNVLAGLSLHSSLYLTYGGKPWSLPRFILVAAKSIATIEPSASTLSNKWFCNVSTIDKSENDDWSFISPANIDSIPDLPALINWFKNGLNYVNS